MKTVGNDDKVWDFPCGPVVNTSPSNTGGAVSIPGHRAKILHALQPKSQNIKQKQYYNKFNKDFKTGPHQKKKIKRPVLGYTNSSSPVENGEVRLAWPQDLGWEHDVLKA